MCYKEIGDKWIDKNHIKRLVISNNVMSYIDWDNRSAQTKFGIKLNRFVGRVLSDIRLIVENKTIRPSRWKYKFIKNQGNLDKIGVFGKEMVTYGNDGNYMTSMVYGGIREYNEDKANVTKVTQRYH